MQSRRQTLYRLLILFLAGTSLARADDAITREYRLKYADITDVSRVLGMVDKHPSGKRIVGGEGKRLVVTDTADEQDMIAELLPVVDQPTKQTVPFKIQMEMLARVSNFTYDRKKAGMAQKSEGEGSGGASPSAGASPSGGVATYDKRSSTQPYKSVYSSEDAELTKKPRVITEEPALPSLSALTLKGIFDVGRGARLGLMVYGSVSYTARDGGLFERNHIQVKGVTSQVLKDRVILVGPDRITREIKFHSTL